MFPQHIWGMEIKMQILIHQQLYKIINVDYTINNMNHYIKKFYVNTNIINDYGKMVLLQHLKNRQIDLIF